MLKFDATHLFVSPTFASGLATLIGSVVILLSFNMSIIVKSGVIGDILLGESRSTGLLDIAENAVFSISALTLENPILNNISFFMFWMLVGLVVFVSLSTLGHTVSKITETIETTHYLNQRKQRIDESTYLRIAVRLTGIAGFLVFYLIFAKFSVPFAVLANQALIGDINGVESWLYGLLGFVVLALSLHVFIICARLAMLKPRLFGGWNALY